MSTERLMGMALKLAAKGRGRTHPNPMVGALVVKNGQIVGRGYHAKAGEEHAEIGAIKLAGGKARNADLYLNLEPCNHHGRTGPCCKAIVNAGIKRVFVGSKDPNPKVNGKGIAALKRSGIKVVAGILEDECYQLNEGFFKVIQERRPFVTFKTAITLDGRVATHTGHSRWVTGAKSQHESHRLRNTHDAIAVGIGTVIDDNPTLTCRGIRGGRDPIRVVVDRRCRIPVDAKIIAAANKSNNPTWVMTTSLKRKSELEQAGAKVIKVGGKGPLALLRSLAEKDVTTLLLEGGPTLAGAFWKAKLIDRVIAFIAPKILADPTALPMLQGGLIPKMSGAIELANISTRKMGDDIMLTGTPLWKGEV